MYSQNAEEAYILEAVKDCSRKSLLDIGAWDPKDKSNSRALIEQGWSAVLIEPSPGPMRNLLKEYGVECAVECPINHAHHRGVQLVQAAVTLDQTVIEMTITDDAVSTSKAEQAELWKERGGYIGKLWVPTMTCNQVFDMFGAFSFINIDVEGYSVDILREVLKSEMFPACICVEHDGRYVEAMQAAADRGYKQVYASGENLVFAR